MGGWSTPRPLYPRERPGTHCVGGWVELRAGLDGCGKSLLHRDSILGPSSPYRLSYRGSNQVTSQKTWNVPQLKYSNMRYWNRGENKYLRDSRMETITGLADSIFYFPKYHHGDEIREDHVGGTRNMQWTNKKYTKHFGRENQRTETWNFFLCRGEDDIKTVIT